MNIITLILSLSFGFVGIAHAATNCDGQPKPALECTTGYSIMCIPVSIDHWGCGKESNGSIIEVGSDGTVTVSTSNSSSITTETEAEASTGGNSVSSGGSVRSGSSESSVRVINSNGTDDDEIELEAEHGKFFLKVNGAEIRVIDETGALRVNIRGWDPKEKRVTITPKEVTTNSDLENFVKVIALSDDNIVHLSIATTTIELAYSQRARFLGLFPWTLTPTVTLSNEAGTTTEVTVRFPWYHVFFKKSLDFSEVEKELEQVHEDAGATGSEVNRIATALQTLSRILKTKHDTVKNSINNVR